MDISARKLTQNTEYQILALLQELNSLLKHHELVITDVDVRIYQNQTVDGPEHVVLGDVRIHVGLKR